MIGAFSNGLFFRHVLQNIGVFCFVFFLLHVKHSLGFESCSLVAFVLNATSFVSCFGMGNGVTWLMVPSAFIISSFCLSFAAGLNIPV